jgi:hypothetical protein
MRTCCTCLRAISTSNSHAPAFPLHCYSCCRVSEDSETLCIFLFSLLSFLPFPASHRQPRVHTPSCQAKSHSVTIATPRPLWNMKVHYGIHKSEMLVPVLNHISPKSLTRLLNIHLHFDLKSAYFPFSHTVPLHVPFGLHTPPISCPLILYFIILLH